MIAKKLKALLDQQGIKYVSLQHSPAYSAAEVAISAHLAGRDFAKTVVVMIEHAAAMLVLPATRRLVLSDLREMLDTQHVRLASETELAGMFPDCEVGAMPPFGNLYGMPVYIAPSLAEEREIAFNAGTHTEVIKLAFADFDRIVRPVVIDLVTT
jgi:Ala-tRNA(Pro) deacylase